MSSILDDDAGVGKLEAEPGMLALEEESDSPPRIRGSVKWFDVDGVLAASLGSRRSHGEVDLPSAENRRNANMAEKNSGIDIIVFVCSFVRLFVCVADILCYVVLCCVVLSSLLG